MCLLPGKGGHPLVFVYRFSAVKYVSVETPRFSHCERMSLSLIPTEIWCKAIVVLNRTIKENLVSMFMYMYYAYYFYFFCDIIIVINMSIIIIISDDYDVFVKVQPTVQTFLVWMNLVFVFKSTPRCHLPWNLLRAGSWRKVSYCPVRSWEISACPGDWRVFDIWLKK